MKIEDLKYLSEVKSKLKVLKIRAKGKRHEYFRISEGVSYKIVSYIYKNDVYVVSATSEIIA